MCSTTMIAGIAGAASYMIVEHIRMFLLSSFVVDVEGIHTNAHVGVFGVHHSRSELQNHSTAHLFRNQPQQAIDSRCSARSRGPYRFQEVEDRKSTRLTSSH